MIVTALLLKISRCQIDRDSWIVGTRGMGFFQGVDRFSRVSLQQENTSFLCKPLGISGLQSLFLIGQCALGLIERRGDVLRFLLAAAHLCTRLNVWPMVYGRKPHIGGAMLLVSFGNQSGGLAQVVAGKN